MRIVCLYFWSIILAALPLIAGDTNSNSSPAPEQLHQGWELVRTVLNPSGNPIDLVLIPEAKISDLANYYAAGNTIAGPRTNCLIYFWAARSQIPTSAWIPVTNLAAMTATYERRPILRCPEVHMASWLYPNAESAAREDAFSLPGVEVSKPGLVTKQTADLDGVIRAIIGALPPGWSMVEDKLNEIPYGHHWNQYFTGPRGLLMVAKGTRPVNAEFGDPTGKWRTVHVATESLKIWLRPGNYRDSFWSRFDISRPVQPKAIVVHGPTKVYASQDIVLLSDKDFWETLSNTNSIDWPDPPTDSPDFLSWKNWQPKLQKAIKNELRRKGVF